MSTYTFEEICYVLADSSSGVYCRELRTRWVVISFLLRKIPIFLVQVKETKRCARLPRKKNLLRGASFIASPRTQRNIMREGDVAGTNCYIRQ